MRGIKIVFDGRQLTVIGIMGLLLGSLVSGSFWRLINCHSQRHFCSPVGIQNTSWRDWRRHSCCWNEPWMDMPKQGLFLRICECWDRVLVMEIGSMSFVNFSISYHSERWSTCGCTNFWLAAQKLLSMYCSDWPTLKMRCIFHPDE